MEFKKFLNYLMRVPCQIVRTGRRIVYRLLSWNPWLEVLLRGAEALHGTGPTRSACPVPTAVRPPLRC